MTNLEKDSYLRLRSPPWKSQREISVMSRIDVDRRLYDRIYSESVPGYRPLDTLPQIRESSNVLIVASHLIATSDVQKLAQWYSEKRVPLLQKEHSWKRTRIFRTHDDAGPSETTEIIVMHEFSAEQSQNDLEATAKASTSGDRDWDQHQADGPELRPYELHYIFGPAPRHLSANAPRYEHGVEGTRTAGANTDQGRSKVHSYVTTDDGVSLPYVLEGSVQPEAPLIVLSNSVLVDWHIWDDFVDDFLSHKGNQGYRILRYETRGRTSDCGSQSITVDLLAKDVLTLLDHLRVEKAAALIGVSLGGATVLNFALKYASRLETVVSCDTNSSSPPGNEKLWAERISIAEKENAVRPNSNETKDRIIGEQLAELTVRRWAVAESYDGGQLESKVQKVKESVIQNSLHGFKNVVKALWDYDLRPKMKIATVRAVFVVGGGDGKLPTSMADMAKHYGTGAEFRQIDGAGHLPMVEKPQEFSTLVTDFLAQS
jgi:pimeloyl-ACP methyl ester carboxylesterase